MCAPPMPGGTCRSAEGRKSGIDVRISGRAADALAFEDEQGGAFAKMRRAHQPEMMPIFL